MNGFVFNIQATLLRVSLALLIAFLLAFPFGFREKGQIFLILKVNTVTQLIMNLLLCSRGAENRIDEIITIFIFLQIFASAVHSLIYTFDFNIKAYRDEKQMHTVIYSLLDGFLVSVLSVFGMYILTFIK